MDRVQLHGDDDYCQRVLQQHPEPFQVRASFSIVIARLTNFGVTRTYTCKVLKNGQECKNIANSVVDQAACPK